MSHDHDDDVCACVVAHNPGMMEGTFHHIWPLGDGGPDVPENLVYLCPTAHYNVHELYRMMKKAGPLSYRECQLRSDRPVNKYAHAIATLGRQWAIAGTLPASAPA